MSRHQYLIVALWSAAIYGTLSCAAQVPDAPEIAQRAAVTIRTDWAAAPDYAFLQRDESQANGKPTSKTHQVVMFAGSDYYMPVATDDLPFPPDRQKSELQKLKDEVARRSQEDPQARQKRAETYRKQREQNDELVTAFPDAFNFVLTGEETIDSHKAYVLAGTPRKRSGSSSRVGKIFAGMRGRIWVDEESFQIVRGEASVTAPVSIFGIFARILPGSEMELELEPVANSLWLARRFSMTLVISKLWFRSTQVIRSTYSDYRSNSLVLEQLLSKVAQ